MNENTTEFFESDSKTERIENAENIERHNGKELPIGASLQNDKYTIEKLFGSGGFGITYLVRHNDLGHLFAIKEFFASGKCVRDADNKTVLLQGIEKEVYNKFLQRFVEEAQTIAKLDHPNIIKVTDIFRENNTAYIVMNFVEGNTLQQSVDINGRLDYDSSIKIIIQLVEAASYMHCRDILHRDIKPENIILTPDGKAILIDFESAREFIQDKTQSHTSILTHGYAPLEQYSASSKKGTYSDIYSLGAVFYFMITGKKPMDAATRTIETMPEAKTLVPEISNLSNIVITKAMELKPENRYQTADDFLTDLKEEKTIVRITSNKNPTIPYQEAQSIYYSIVYLVVLVATIFGIKYGIKQGMEVFPLFSLPLILISFIMHFKNYNIKNGLKTIYELKPIWVAIPIIVFFIVWWLWLWQDFESVKRLLNFEFYNFEIYYSSLSREFLSAKLNYLNPELWLPIFIFISIFSLLTVGKQLSIIRNDKVKILQNITITISNLIINIFLSLLISVFTVFFIVAILFLLKPHYQQFVLPLIGLVFILILLFIQLENKKKHYKAIAVSTVIISILIGLVWIKDLKYDTISDYSEGFAIVKKESMNYDLKKYRKISKYAYIDLNGNLITDFKYSSAEKIINGIAYVGVLRNDTLYYGIINNKGVEITPLNYYNIESFDKDFSLVKTSPNLYYNLIDNKTGKLLSTNSYYKICEFSEGLAAVMNNNYRWGFIDKLGKVVVPCIYSQVKTFSEGLAAVLNKNRWGYIDRTGEIIIPCNYYRADSFINSRAKVSITNKQVYYETSRTLVWDYYIGEYKYRYSKNKKYRNVQVFFHIDKTGKKL